MTDTALAWLVSSSFALAGLSASKCTASLAAESFLRRAHVQTTRPFHASMATAGKTKHIPRGVRDRRPRARREKERSSDSLCQSMRTSFQGKSEVHRFHPPPRSQHMRRLQCPPKNERETVTSRTHEHPWQAIVSGGLSPRRRRGVTTAQHLKLYLALTLPETSC